MFNIVLVEPEIPANTGNIARTCAVTGCSLHLIKPLGFSIADKHLKRAGLDYWHLLDLHVYESFGDLLSRTEPEMLYLATTKGKRHYAEASYPEGAYLVFGKETKGLPPILLESMPSRCIRIPMCENANARSLNLSNSVAVVVFEAFRQHGFLGLK